MQTQSKINTVDTVPELELLEKSKSQQIRDTFEPMSKMLAGFEESYNQIVEEANIEITDEVTWKAKDLRLSIARIRTSTEKVRKREKEEYLRAGKAIDGVSNILKWAIVEKEEKLKDIENHFEKMEQERLVALQFKRHKLLSPYMDGEYVKDLSAMEEDVFSAYLEAKKRDFQARKEAERQAELNRLKVEKEAEEEHKRMIAENERLKKEAQEREAKAEAERKAREQKERKEREEREKEQAAAQAKAKAEYDAHQAELRKEREERERIQKELEAKAEAERKAIEAEELRRRKDAQAAEESIQAELSKGDEDKVTDLKNDLNRLKSKYVFDSAKNKKMYADVSILINKVIGHIENLSIR